MRKDSLFYEKKPFFLSAIDTPFHASFASSRHSSNYLNRITQKFGGMSSYLYFCSQKQQEMYKTRSLLTWPMLMEETYLDIKKI